MTLRSQSFAYTIAALLCFALGYWWSHPSAVDLKSLKETSLLPEPRVIASIEDVGAGDTFKGHWSWVFFGFTRCPQLCPTTLSQMHAARELTNKLSSKALPEVFMISLDPERETTQDIQHYVKSFDDTFRGLRLERSQLDKLTHELGIVYIKEILAKQSGKAPEDYTINHSGTILILNPEGKLAGFFNMPHDPMEMGREFAKVIA